MFFLVFLGHIIQQTGRHKHQSKKQATEMRIPCLMFPFKAAQKKTIANKLGEKQKIYSIFIIRHKLATDRKETPGCAARVEFKCFS